MGVGAPEARGRGGEGQAEDGRGHGTPPSPSPRGLSHRRHPPRPGATSMLRTVRSAQRVFPSGPSCRQYGGMADYRVEHARSIEDPEGYWAEQAQLVDWIKKPRRILDDDHPPFYRWFPDATLNTCYNALDRHVVHGHGDRTALIYDSAVADSRQSYSYARLLERTAAFAGALQALGVEPGDRVVIYMPMVPEAVMAMLACARIGAIHSVVFGGFAATELANRINHAKPKIVVTASCGIEVGRVVDYKPLLDAAIDMAVFKPERCIVLQRDMLEVDLNPDQDVDWADAMATAKPADCVPVAATDPLYILYTSGTTGQPKGIVRDNGGHAVALEWTMKQIYDVEPGEVYWAASDIGWVVGHSYIVYGPLFHGCTTVLYEGKPVGTPDPGAFWRVIADHRVCTLFTAPTAFRAIRQQDPEGVQIGRYDLSGFAPSSSPASAPIQRHSDGRRKSSVCL